MEHLKRFFVPTKPTLIEGFRAFRSYLERLAESQGKKLDPAWYKDGPEDRPGLYKDQPHLLPPSNRPDPNSPPAPRSRRARCAVMTPLLSALSLKASASRFTATRSQTVLGDS